MTNTKKLIVHCEKRGMHGFSSYKIPGNHHWSSIYRRHHISLRTYL